MRSGLIRFVWVFAIIVLPLAFTNSAATSQVVPKKRPADVEASASKINYGSVYLLRGLADVFSLGMNTLARELRERGVDAVVTNHIKGMEIADELAKKYQTDKKVLPIIIIGHSLGGNKALLMSERLAKDNIPVRLVVLFDPTVAIPVPPNVEEVLNLYKPSKVGVAVAGAPDFKGEIKNQNVSDIPGVGHISIDKAKTLHTEVVDKVMSILEEKRYAKNN
jgi:hypothetical protein